MSRTPRRYAVNLHLVGGQTERVFFPKLETFQKWYPVSYTHLTLPTNACV